MRAEQSKITAAQRWPLALSIRLLPIFFLIFPQKEVSHPSLLKDLLEESNPALPQASSSLLRVGCVCMCVCVCVCVYCRGGN